MLVVSGAKGRGLREVEEAVARLDDPAVRPPLRARAFLRLSLARRANGDLGGAEDALGRSEAVYRGLADERGLARGRRRTQLARHPARADTWKAKPSPNGRSGLSTKAKRRPCSRRCPAFPMPSTSWAGLRKPGGATSG